MITEDLFNELKRGDKLTFDFFSSAPIREFVSYDDKDDIVTIKAGWSSSCRKPLTFTERKEHVLKNYSIVL
jgi:hypothetical protein